MATAVAGAVMGIHPFDQPDVEASKIATRALTAAFEESGLLPAESPVARDGQIPAFTDASNLAALATGGRLVVIALMGGGEAQVNLRELLSRRLAIVGSTLRTRSVEEKSGLVAAFLDRFGDLLSAYRLRPVIDRVLPLEQAAEAHRVMAASRHFGKIVLRVR